MTARPAKGYAYPLSAAAMATLGLLLLVVVFGGNTPSRLAKSETGTYQARTLAHEAFTIALASGPGLDQLTAGMSPDGGALRPCTPTSECVTVVAHSASSATVRVRLTRQLVVTVHAALSETTSPTLQQFT